ncbi:MAG TPA: acyltransferase [Rhodopila sp.]
MSASNGIPRVASSRIPSLDGLRAVSIGLVILAHSVEFLPPHLAGRGLAAYGSIGVSIFFVISGFLITSILLDEKSSHNRIDIRNFYIRRIVRIMPAYYCFLAIMILLSACGLFVLTSRDIIASLLFVRDYKTGAQSYLLGHTWSLSVEEQFYLFWPVTVWLFGRTALLRLCIAVIVICPVLRVLTYVAIPDLRDAIDTMFHTRADTLIFGCVLALLWRSERTVALPGWLLKAPTAAAACVFLLVVSPYLRLRFGGAYIFPVGLSAEGLAIVSVICWAVARPTTLTGRLLNSRPVVAIGVLSYSIYLWQQIFLVPDMVGLPKFYPLNLGLVIVAAATSYYALEKPLIGLRQRLHRRSVASRQGIAPGRDVTSPGQGARVSEAG